MKKLSFFLLLTSFNTFSTDVDGLGIDSSNSSCYVINVGEDGTEVKTGEDGSGTKTGSDDSNVKTVVICEEKIS
jgi:hypothetical protein